MPDATGLELIAADLRSELSDQSVLDTIYFRERATVVIDPSVIRPVLDRLRTNHGFNFMASLHGIDYHPHEPRLGVHYELLSMTDVDRLTVKLRVSTATPEVDSAVPDTADYPGWPTADHQEREVYDMFGVIFSGHPDLRRILMPEDYEGHPQRRDFPIGGEPVLFTYNESSPQVSTYDGPTTPVTPGDGATHDDPDAVVSEYRRREQSITLAPVREQLGEQERDRTTHELLTLNMGPHHPATHGVLRLLVTLEGEVVREIKPVIGYVHTGIEKTAEDKSYWKVIPVVERMDYLSYYFNSMAYIGAVEALTEVQVPPRAQYLRVIHMELNRIMSHLVWLGTSALDLGAISMFWYCFRERETILDLFEFSSGQRMHTRYFQVGGVAEDIPVGFAEKLAAFVDLMPTRADQYGAMLNRNEIVLQRLRGTCPLDADTLLSFGVTGPLLRAAGNPWDLRKAAPYCSYQDFEFKIPVGTVGDNYDRFACRLAEIYESVKIIDQALQGLPEGPHITEDRKFALPPRHELATSMEALIHHFKLVTEGFRVPPGEVYHAIEGARGELGCFVASDGSSKPARVHMRDASFVNLQALSSMAEGAYIADLVATLAMLDPILGGIDR